MSEHNVLNASSAAIQVGYESPSQFSREYRRKFGAPLAGNRQLTTQLRGEYGQKE